jgi:hypothetical protein
MADAYEKLGAFYLGKTYDLDAAALRDDLLLFDSKDLTTHGVCFGMTGSGKTGLCVCVLEEALIDGIPVIAIDPKGDLGNLLLNFPELKPEQFRPWVQESAARQEGQTPDEYAVSQAELWKQGLAKWDQSGDRIRRLRDAAEMAIYTPGSEAGIPVSMLKSFAAPSEQLRNDREQMRDRVQAAAGSLLGLVGIDADPVQSREHILLSLLLDKAWREGRDLSLAELIQQIQNPPVERVGVFDLESFYPSKERFGLAMAINNLLASPGFEAWMSGEALDLDKLLYTPEGKPRLAIFSIAHLGDAERMFFVSSLLGETLSWMRRQPGTTSLRALLYMDEIYGYLPPTANPPSKQPLMTLMKQARAFGVGVLLATQNPKDLDYKALSNAGAWFVGRLQTDRDRDRVLDGLEGAAAGSGAAFDRADMERKISGLGKRVFLLYNVHEKAPEAFQTRWALSYLCGPLTRDQIEQLMAPRKGGLAQPAAGAPIPAGASAGQATLSESAPALPPDIAQYFAPLRTIGPADARLEYRPSLVAVARVHYSDRKTKLDQTHDLTVWTVIEDAPTPVDWQAAEDFEIQPDDLESAPRPDHAASFAGLSPDASKAKNYGVWSKRLAAWIYAERPLELYLSPTLGQTSDPGENERDFRVRLDRLAREERDLKTEKLRQKYSPKIATLEDRIRRAQQTVEKEKEQAGSQTIQSALSIGSTLLGALFGRKVLSATNVRRAGTAVRGVSRIGKERSDVGRAEENVDALREQLEEINEELAAEISEIESQLDPQREVFETIAVKAKKTDVDVRFCALTWLPYWTAKAGVQPAWR